MANKLPPSKGLGEGSPFILREWRLFWDLDPKPCNEPQALNLKYVRFHVALGGASPSSKIYEFRGFGT